MIWLPTLVVCSIATRRTMWVHAARIGHALLFVALFGVITETLSVIVQLDLLRKPLEGSAWAAAYILALTSIVTAPLGCLLSYGLSRSSGKTQT
ncbi:MAG TPA: hypothetical protein VKH35_01790 [Thermoanaerobaculia bacterium]|nr:hypothetical protein [Thermoanaerobaculia bacterium]